MVRGLRPGLLKGLRMESSQCQPTVPLSSDLAFSAITTSPPPPSLPACPGKNLARPRQKGTILWPGEMGP